MFSLKRVAHKQFYGVVETTPLLIFQLRSIFFSKIGLTPHTLLEKKGGVMRAPKEVLHKLQVFCGASPRWSLWSRVRGAVTSTPLGDPIGGLRAWVVSRAN